MLDFGVSFEARYRNFSYRYVVGSVKTRRRFFLLRNMTTLTNPKIAVYEQIS